MDQRDSHRPYLLSSEARLALPQHIPHLSATILVQTQVYAFFYLSPPAVVGFRPHLSEPSSLALWDNGTMPLNPRPFSAQGVPPAVVGSRVYTMADIKIIADRQCKDPVGVQSTR